MYDEGRRCFSSALFRQYFFASTFRQHFFANVGHLIYIVERMVNERLFIARWVLVSFFQCPNTRRDLFNAPFLLGKNMATTRGHIYRGLSDVTELRK
jgi:hypothetical protein